MHASFRNAGLGIAAIALALFSAGGPAGAGDLEVIEAGKLNVAFNGDMPGTSYEDGRLIGLDGELMHMVADELGLEVVPNLMEWAAEIQSVKTGRVDVMHGMMGWNDQRIKVINITDPIYYGGANITQKKSTNWSTVKELEGRTIATIQGWEFMQLTGGECCDSSNVGSYAGDDPNVLNFIGTDDFDAGLGLSPTFAVDVITQVGNYQEIYEKHLPQLGLALEGSPNDLWLNGGLMYAPPYR